MAGPPGASGVRRTRSRPAEATSQVNPGTAAAGSARTRPSGISQATSTASTPLWGTTIRPVAWRQAPWWPGPKPRRKATSTGPLWQVTVSGSSTGQSPAAPETVHEPMSSWPAMISQPTWGSSADQAPGGGAAIRATPAP